jgi:hypothetical protein
MISAPSPDLTMTDRRVAPRLQPAYRTVCRLKHRGDSGLESIGLVWNLSETGVSMLMADPPQAGAELSGELAAESGGPGLPISIRVMHVRPMSTGDYILGARFGNRLAADEMKTFLAAPPKDADGTDWNPPKKG